MKSYSAHNNSQKILFAKNYFEKDLFLAFSNAIKINNQRMFEVSKNIFEVFYWLTLAKYFRNLRIFYGIFNRTFFTS